MSETKQIPTIQNTLDMMPISHFYDEKTGKMVCFAEDIKSILEYRDKEVVKYTLQQAAENGKLNILDMDGTYFQSETFTYGENDVSIHKQSILSLEDSIIKDLKL